MKLNKYENNPILSPLKNHPWENFCVLNPGVVFDNESNKFIMLYRAAGDDIKHKISLGLATSEDGFNFVRCFDKPVLNPPETEIDGGCVEDPRIVKIDDYYYVSYAARAFCPGRYWLPTFKEERSQWFKAQKDTVPTFYRINHTVTYLAMTKDFINFVRLGRITDSRIDDRDVVIFPRRINGKFVRISRPAIEGDYSMKIAFSDDLLEWGSIETLYKGVEWWEDLKVGASCPPIEINEGWLLIYHGVSNKDKKYRVGILLLDKDDPRKILGKTSDFIMEPDQTYECSGGLYDGCVFPTGAVLKDNTVYVYYGCADKYVSVATTSLNEILNELKLKKGVKI